MSSLLNIITRIVAYMRPKELKGLTILQILLLVAGLLEIALLMTFGYFLSIVLETTSALATPNILLRLSAWFSIDVVLFTGLLLLLVTLSSSVVNLYSIWRLNHFASEFGVALGSRVFEKLIRKQWNFHTSNKSSALINLVMIEAQRVTSNIIIPILLLNAKCVLILAVLISLFVVNPLVTANIVIIISLFYLVVFLSVKSRLSDYGTTISKFQQQRMSILSDAFELIADVILGDKHAVFERKFNEASDHYALAQARSLALSNIPRFVIEFLVIFGGVSSILILGSLGGGTIQNNMTEIAVFCFAGVRVIPSAQQIFASVSHVRAHSAALESIDNYLIDANRTFTPVDKTKKKIGFSRSIELQNVSLSLKQNSPPILSNVDLKLETGKVYGVFGPSGGGKSTLALLLTGLLKPDQGQILFDGKDVKDVAFGSDWLTDRATILSQKPHLINASIVDNVMFDGSTITTLNENPKLKSVLDDAHIHPIFEIHHPLRDLVSTRKLSGGQVQRIGLARALYCDARLMILDEPTAALDGNLEEKIFEVIRARADDKITVVITHSSSFKQFCDEFFFIENGKLRKEFN